MDHQDDFLESKEAQEVTCGVKAIWKTNLASHKKEEMKDQMKDILDTNLNSLDEAMDSRASLEKEEVTYGAMKVMTSLRVGMDLNKKTYTTQTNLINKCSSFRYQNLLTGDNTMERLRCKPSVVHAGHFHQLGLWKELMQYCKETKCLSLSSN